MALPIEPPYPAMEALPVGEIPSGPQWQYEPKWDGFRCLAFVKPPGFTGNAPGGPSRWSTKRSTEWQPLAPRLVAEVQYDHFTGDRFRHGTKFLRWRPDKSPRQCTKAQLGSAGRSSITETLKTGTRRI
jgi:ATP-dependent DNA ligase